MPSLLVNDPATRSETRFSIFKRVTSIGSGADNDIRLRSEEVDDTHAIVRYDGRSFILQAVGATAQLVVNGRRKTKHTLSHEDDVLIGGVPARFLLHEPAVDPNASSGFAEGSPYRKLFTFSQRLLENYELPALLEELMDAIIALSHADKGFLILMEEDEPVVHVARNVEHENIEDAVAQLSDSIVSTVARTREPLIVSDALHDEQFKSSRSVMNLELCSVMCVPLVHRDELLGILYVGNDNVVNLFSEEHLQLLTIFASQATLIVANALQLDELAFDNAALRHRLHEMRFGRIIGACDAMRRIFKRVEKVAATDVTVLIEGETGTGKELIAREIHERSNRADGPFVTINCGAIPENLLESELFGHERGAFTGASKKRVGKFEAADGGTLFLDEIGELPLALQVKILRALQEREISPVGASDTRPVDIRVLAATNRSLAEMVEDGAFREDLFYRLNVVSLRLPPLRERGEDVEVIAQYLVQRFSDELGLSERPLGRDAKVAIRKHRWPGNIRELENRIKKALILAEGSVITDEDLGLEETELRAIVPLAEARDAWQREYILDALELNAGNRTQTARDLGVDPRTVFRFLEKEAERDDESDEA